MAQWIGIFIGIISGIGALVLGVMNYVRDNPNLSLSLVWDLEPFGNTPFEKDKLYGVIKITNIGRRPIFISQISIRIPGSKELLITESITGEKIGEGDHPKIYPIDQDGLEKYAELWDKMYAVVRDSAEREYLSRPPKNKPSWGK